MVVKRGVGILLASTALGAAIFVAGPARADDAQTEQLQRQINALQKQLQSLQGQVTETKKTAQAAQQAAQSAPPPAATAGLYNAAPPGSAAAMPTKAPSWMSGVTIKVGGFVAMESAWRQRSELSGGATDPGFGTIPFSNSPLYSENEARFSAQQSRLSLAAFGDINPAEHLKAYYEMDFLGSGVTANSRESNSYNLRIRQGFFEYDNDNYHFHVSAGQQWSLLTQERVGMLPTNENAPLSIDAQYVAGFNWARQPGVRFVADYNKIAWFGVSVENPETAFPSNSAGAAGAAVASLAGSPAVAGMPIPTGLAVNPGNTCNNSGLLDNQTLCGNTVAPDIIEKFALDPGWGHYEVFGLERWFADQVATTAIPNSWSQKVVMGWGVGGSVLLPVVPKYVDLQGSVLTGQGISRYGSGQLSDVTIGPNGALAPLQATHFLVGAVVHPMAGLDVYAYYGQEQVSANSWKLGAEQGGYGNPAYINTGCSAEALTSTTAAAYNVNSSTTCAANVQKTQEFTVGFWQDLYKGSLGRVAAGMQYEYVRLTAFPGVTVGAGTPNQGLNPNNNIFFTSLRYYPFP